MTIVIVLVVVWCLVALVFGLALARVLGGISHGTHSPRRRHEHEDDNHIARSA
jgi:hypothetical protein